MNLPEKWESLDERDKLRGEPVTIWNDAQLKVIEFMLQLRRNTTGNRELTKGEQDVANVYFQSRFVESQSTFDQARAALANATESGVEK